MDILMLIFGFIVTLGGIVMLGFGIYYFNKEPKNQELPDMNPKTPTFMILGVCVIFMGLAMLMAGYNYKN